MRTAEVTVASQCHEQPWHEHNTHWQGREPTVHFLMLLGVFQGYELGASELDFAITISITSTTNATNASVITESLQLDPSDPYVLDDANLVSAELLGDLLTYDALEVFTSYYLMIPSPTGSQGSLLLDADQPATAPCTQHC